MRLSARDFVVCDCILCTDLGHLQYKTLAHLCLPRLPVLVRFSYYSMIFDNLQIIFDFCQQIFIIKLVILKLHFSLAYCYK